MWHDVRKIVLGVAALLGGLWMAFAHAGDGKMLAEGSPTQIRLPERISPMDLKQLAMDLPGSIQMVDIRPPHFFADYHVPGSRNVDVLELLSNPVYLTGAGSLIVIDRDGSLAMAVAGILSQKTPRPIKALHGGLDAYWTETELRSIVREVPLPASSGESPSREPGGEPAPPSVAPSEAPPGEGVPQAPSVPHPPEPPTSGSAGC